MLGIHNEQLMGQGDHLIGASTKPGLYSHLFSDCWIVQCIKKLNSDQQTSRRTADINLESNCFTWNVPHDIWAD